MHIPFLLIFTIFSPLLHGMETNDYSAQCLTIRTFLEHEKNDFFEMIYRKHLDPMQELARINQQFLYYKKKLSDERNESLLQLKKFHNISDEVWSEGMKSLDIIKTEVKNHINTILPDAIHDPIISGENKIVFAKQLNIYGLDIKKICIKKKYTPNHELVSFLSVVKDEHPNNGTINVNKPKITLSSTEFEQLSSTQQQALLSKFAWIMGNNCTFSSAFIAFIATKTNKDYNFNTLQQSKDYLSFLTSELYNFSEIFPCLEDDQVCQFMENWRSTSSSHPHNIEQNRDHFQHICTIKNLWEKRKMLEKLIQK